MKQNNKNNNETKESEIKKPYKKNKLQFQGMVVSDKMDKTVIVRVEKIKQDPKYKKRYKIYKKYFAHSDNNEYKTGDKVMIELSRPLSKNKRWRVIKKC
jgi:small subunit ribosomal protein S17